MITLKFRTVAVDETVYWGHLNGKVYGLYLFCEDEKTYCASLDPSSWCQFLETVFTCLDKDGNMLMADMCIENGADQYLPFINVEKAEAEGRVSNAFEFTEDTPAECREAAYEYFRGNTQHPPILLRKEA